MSTKEELLKEIEALKAKVEALEETPKEVTRFKPGPNKKYYTILLTGEVYPAVNYNVELSYNFGNIFRDQETAERYAKYRAARQRLELLALELNGPDFPLVPKLGIECYSIYSDCLSDHVTVLSFTNFREGNVYFKTRTLARKAIELTSNEDLIELYGVGKE